MMKKRDPFDLLTVLTLIATLLLILWEITVAINPWTPLNPFPPKAGGAGGAMAAASPTPTRSLPPTWTPTPSPSPTPTLPPTFTPTATLTPSPSPTPEPTATPTPRVTRSPYPFTYELSYETPYYGCNWAGVAGLVQDLDGNPLTGYRVHVWGGGIDAVLISGSFPMYGESGWEQFFNNYPIKISGEYKVQLHDKNPPYAAVSDVIVLDYQGLCSRSMAFIVFTKNH